MPGEDGLRFDDVSHFLQGFLPQLQSDLGEGLALAVTQPEVPLDLVAEDTILRAQIFVAQQEFLIDRPCDIC